MAGQEEWAWILYLWGCLMSDAVVLHEKLGSTHLLTINRPKALNALNAEVIAALDAGLDLVEADPDARALILTGAGKAFVAGADIAQMRDLTPDQAEAFAAQGQRLADRMAAMSVATIAAVGGFALGGGCELAMACDILLGGEAAKFGQPEVNLGVIPGFGGTQRLVRRVGLSVALDLCLTGRIIDADEALRIGLLSRKVSGDVLEAARGVADEIAVKGPVAIRLCKRALHENADSPLASGLAAERKLFAACFETSDQKEGMAAFLERRKANFTGR